ncbi:MAG TPA: fibronectin type III domain-containing protein [Gemmatimonadaceae bacterium]|nr:fibronectin type III domain-containing protein [Gemmatimonadaceae bacterium]
MINNRMLVIVAAMLANAAPLTAQIIQKDPIVSPTLYTGAPPTGFRVTDATPASVAFSWAATSGAVSYQIMRTSTAGGSWTWLAPNPIAATTLTYSDQSGVDYRSSYTYRLQVNYASGPSGYVDLPVTLPKPVNPTNVRAKQTNSGAVTISWNGTGLPATVFGPGIPDGHAVVNGESYTASNLANGQTYSWSVGTVYQPGNISTPASEFPSASAAVLPFMGNYRITLLGFTVGNPTVDDLLDSDGKMDEIMPMVFVRQFDQASGVAMGAPTVAKGYIHGDNQGKFRARVRAGTASNTGGIQKGDVFPAGLMQGPPGSPSTTTFPLKVFEGFLTRDHEALVLYPSLWETDDAPSRWFDGYLSGLPPRTQDALNPSTTVGAKLRQALDAPGISEIRGEDKFRMDSWGPNPTGDRPIGIQQSTSSDDSGGFFDRIIVLNQRKIEEALAQPAKYPGMPAGTIGLSFTEGGVLHVTGLPDPMSWNFSANYVLYLRVEALR